ncbi:MAG: MoaD/ThiS family protein [Deltaproteobacteria bacterium]|nr:MoaD/ThiS family protein [Deltaproteobacteria bacterium]
MLAFAAAADLLGVAQLRWPLDGPCTAQGLMAALCARYPQLGRCRQWVRLAVNGRYARPEQPVVAGDEVALIPPVAGG